MILLSSRFNSKAVLYYRSWWDWSGIGVGWVPTLPSQTPTIHPWQFFWLIIVSVPKINPISFNIKTSMVGLGGMEWDWVGWMINSVFLLQNLTFQEMFIWSPFWKCVCLGIFTDFLSFMKVEIWWDKCLILVVEKWKLISIGLHIWRFYDSIHCSIQNFDTFDNLEILWIYHYGMPQDKYKHKHKLYWIPKIC